MISTGYKRTILIICLILSAQILSKEYTSNLIFQNTSQDEENNEDFLIDIPLNRDSYSKSVFLLDLSIGDGQASQKQNFKVLFDTGSSYLVILNKDCKGCLSTSSSILNKTNKYDTSISPFYQTFYKEESISYGIGFTKGIQAYDRVSLKGINGSVDLKFLLADEISDLNGTYDGIIGALYSAKDTDLITNLYLSRLVKRNLFSVYLKNKENLILSIGEYPDIVQKEIMKRGNDKFISSCNVNTNSYHWTCTSDLISMTKSHANPIELKNEIIIDTGSSDSRVTSALFNSLINNYFLKYLGKECKLNKGQDSSSLTCSTISTLDINDIVINFNGSEITLKKHEYFQKMNIKHTDIYMFAFSGVHNTERSFSILGMNILRRFIVIFNKEEKKVGFIKKSEMTVVLFDEKDYEDDNDYSTSTLINTNDTEFPKQVDGRLFDNNGFYYHDVVINLKIDQSLINNYIEYLKKFYSSKLSIKTKEIFKSSLVEMTKNIKSLLK